MKVSPGVVAVLCGALLIGPAVLADPPPGKGRPDKSGHATDSGRHQEARRNADAGLLVQAGISVSTARELAVTHRATGYERLPPGIRKNLARGKPLPPGLARRAVPAGVLAGLPDHRGYEWQVLGSDLVLVAITSAVIADILVGVFD